MFEELFTQPRTIQRYRDAPLLEERLSYLLHLKDLGAKPEPLRTRALEQLHLVRLLDLKAGDNVSVAQVKTAAREWSLPGRRGYVRTRLVPAPSTSTERFIRRALDWLRYLGWLDEPPVAQHAWTAEVAAFKAWMSDQRGLSTETIRSYDWALKHFFDWLAQTDLALAAVTINDIDEAIKSKHVQDRWSRATKKIYALRLCSFFRFLEEQGWCKPGIAIGIKAPRFYPTQAVPKGLTWKNVERILATTEGDSPTDIRDRAILMLLTAYALRASEVAGLELDDLDWEKETLRVRRSKPGRADVYPLSQSVGRAILRYILEVRTSYPDRALFFTLRAPLKPITTNAIWHIVRLRVARLAIESERRGPHALRHAAAQHLLNQGVSVKVIGDYLGHGDPTSTSIYAKFHLETLREVAEFNLEGLV